jgi:hypothetical protein
VSSLVPGAAPTPLDASGQPQQRTVAPYVIGGLAILAVAGIAWYVWKKRKAQTP